MIENIRLAFRGILAHKFRSFLTMLGIIIGIAAIMAIYSVITGTNEQIKEDLIGSGNNAVTVTLYQGDYQYEAEYGSGTPPILTQKLKDRVKSLAHVTGATFYYSRDYTQNVFYMNTRFSGGKIYGVDSDYLDTCAYQVIGGRGFVPQDYARFAKVALVDANASESLFQGVHPLGKTIEIGQEPFVVVGIIDKKADAMPKVETMMEFNEYYSSTVGTIFIPDKSWPTVFKFDEPMNAVVKADNTDNMSTVGKAAADVLNESIGSATSNFVYKADDILEKVRNTQQLQQSTNMLLIVVAAISLVVGGIGVANIMLVTVTERTSEIGLKKAIGARKRTIRAQFLTEAIVLTSLGGIIGVLGGLGLSKIVSNVMEVPTALSLTAIAVAVSVSMLTGIISGLFPAIKASNLNPIDALRSE